MKLSHSEIAGQKDADKIAAPRQQNALSRTLAKYATIGAIALALPLAGANAHAQPRPEGAQPAPTAPAEVPAEAPAEAPPAHVQPAAPAAASESITVTGSRRAVLTCPEGSRDVHVVSSQSSLHPSFPVAGGRLTIRFYPAVLSERFTSAESQYPRQVEYTLAPAGGAGSASSIQGTTRRSQCTCPAEVAGSLVVGTPIERTIQIPQGRHTMTVNSPNGLLEIVRFEEILAPVPIPRPAVRPDQPAVPSQPETQPAQDAQDARDARRHVVSFEGEMAPLHGIGTSGLMEDGSTGNVGDLYRARILGTIPLSDHFGLIVGGMFSSYGLRLTTAQAETGLRGYTGVLGAGLSYQNGGHYLYGIAFGGYRGISTSVQSFADGRSIDEMAHTGEFLGVAGYNYSQYLGLRVEGGNNPFNPLSARVFGAIPFTWAEGVYPYVEADFLWLHALAPRESPDFVGLTTLSENAFHIRALAGIPIYRLGPIVPMVVGGGEFNIAGGSLTSGTGILGGALRADFVPGLDIEAIGAATFHGDPLVLLRVGYTR